MSSSSLSSSSSSRSLGLDGSFESWIRGEGGGSNAAAASAREASSCSLGRWKYSKALSRLRLFRLGFGGDEGSGRDRNGDAGGVMVGSDSSSRKQAI